MLVWHTGVRSHHNACAVATPLQSGRHHAAHTARHTHVIAARVCWPALCLALGLTHGSTVFASVTPWHNKAAPRAGRSALGTVRVSIKATCVPVWSWHRWRPRHYNF